MKYEHIRIPSNISLIELSEYRSKGWIILLAHKFDGKDCFLLERVLRNIEKIGNNDVILK